MKKKPEPRPSAVKGGREALKRTAELVRKIVAVPKSEIPPDMRKQPEPEGQH